MKTTSLLLGLTLVTGITVGTIGIAQASASQAVKATDATKAALPPTYSVSDHTSGVRITVEREKSSMHLVTARHWSPPDDSDLQDPFTIAGGRFVVTNKTTGDTTEYKLSATGDGLAAAVPASDLQGSGDNEYQLVLSGSSPSGASTWSTGVGVGF